MTLKRMYHCVPSSISTMLAVLMPPPMLDDGQQDHGKQRGGRNAGGNLRQGLRIARKFGLEADGDAGRNAPCQRQQQAQRDACKGGSGGAQG